jgi:hypothetical protein
LDTEKKPEATAKPNDILDSVSIAAFDLDGRIFRTLWHSLIRTPDVALAGATGNYSQYLSPLRVFVALFSFQFVVASLFGTPLAGSLDQLTVSLEPDAVEAWLATGRNAAGEIPTAAEVNQTIESWGAMLLWPITVITALPYLLLLKLYRPSVPLWGHLQFFLAATNASFVVMIATIPLIVLGLGWFSLGIAFAMVVYYFCTGRIVVRFYSHSAGGAALRLLGLFLLMPVTLLMTGIGQILGTAFTLDVNYDLSLIRLYAPDLQ